MMSFSLLIMSETPVEEDSAAAAAVAVRGNHSLVHPVEHLQYLSCQLTLLTSVVTLAYLAKAAVNTCIACFAH